MYAIGISTVKFTSKPVKAAFWESAERRYAYKSYCFIIKIMWGKTGRQAVAAILILIPFAVYFDVPYYNVVAPTFGGLPFFYWFQMLMLPVSALLFIIAAYLIDW